MPTSLCRRGVRGLARHGGRGWRHNNRGLRMPFGNCVVDIVPVVRPVTSKRSDRACDLIEQRADPRTVVDIVGGQLRRRDLPGTSIHTDVIGIPGSRGGYAPEPSLWNSSMRLDGHS